jgi:hypothetical protein
MRRVPLVALAVALLGACSSNQGTDQAAVTTEPPTTVEPTTTTDAGPQAEQVGQPFTTMWHVGDGSGETEMKVTVKRPITCGIKGYQLPNGSSVDANKKEHLAPKGMRFCQINFKLQNTGKKRTWSPPAGLVYDNQGREFPSDDQVAVDISPLSSMRWAGNQNELLPTETTEELMVVPIPIGAEPKSLSLEASAGEPVPVDIKASDIEWKNPKGS